MTITFRAKAYKIKKRKVWHKKFVIFPKRTQSNELQFLTYVGRRLMPNYTSSVVMWLQYEYKDLQQIITDKLMGKQN